MRRVVLLLADAAVLVLLRPDFVAVGRELSHPRAWMTRIGADAVCATLAAAGLWVLAVWVGLSIGLVAAAHLPGALGRAAAAASPAVVPGVVRRVVAGTAGLGVLLTPVAAGASRPSDGAPAAVAVAASRAADSAAAVAAPGMHTTGTPTPDTPLPTPAWPTSDDGPIGSAPLPAPAWPVATQPTRPSRPARSGRAADTSGERVQVRRGDSLWLLAARRLGPHAPVSHIAREWPRWYAANRAAIGADPDRLAVGTVLRPPGSAR